MSWTIIAVLVGAGLFLIPFICYFAGKWGMYGALQGKRCFHRDTFNNFQQGNFDGDDERETGEESPPLRGCKEAG